MVWKVLRWIGVGFGPSKGLEGRKIGHDIILCRLLKIGNLRTKLVCALFTLTVTVNDEYEQKEEECFQLPAAKRQGWAIFRCKMAMFYHSW